MFLNKICIILLLIYPLVNDTKYDKFVYKYYSINKEAVIIVTSLQSTHVKYQDYTTKILANTFPYMVK